MPFQTTWTDPAPFLTVPGPDGKPVTVYHHYKDNDLDNGPLTYHFVMDPNDEDDSFDVRDLVNSEANAAAIGAGLRIGVNHNEPGAGHALQ